MLALKSAVGKTSELVSTLLILFAINIADNLSVSTIGDTFVSVVVMGKFSWNDFALANSFVSFILEATIDVVVNLKFSPKGTELKDVSVTKEVSEPLGLVAVVFLSSAVIVVLGNSNADRFVLISSNL